MKKQITSIFAMLLSLLLLVSSIPLTATAATSSDAWDGTSSDTDWAGTGSSTDPYQISSAAELKGLSVQVNSGTNYSGKYFKQTADINLGGKDWTPIGLTSSTAFKGNYNGGGHTISNLHVDEDTLGSNLDSAGLFGHVNGGTTSTSTVTIENLSVIGGEIKSNKAELAYNSTRVVYSGLGGLWKAGVIAANATGLTLNNVYTDVDIYPSYNTAVNSSNTSQHYGLYAGGLIGSGSAQITINACVAKGNISFYNEDNLGTTSAPNCPRFFWIGGLIGNCAHGGFSSTTRSINGSFYTGTISVLCLSNNSNTRVGGLAGGWMNKATINNCYMLGNVDFISLSAGNLYSVGTVVGFLGTTGGGDTGTKITNTKIYNQYENSNTANTSANYLYTSQPVGKQGTNPNGEISVSTITGGTNNPITLRSYQYGTGENASAFRLLATISTLDYQNVGYTVTAVDGTTTGTWDDPVSGVYTTINADGQEYTAAHPNIGGNEGDYIVALAINGIPQSGIVAMEVTPYVVLQNGDKIHGNTAVLLFKNGQMTDCYGLKNDVEADRITALGTDLSNFKIVYDGTSKATAGHVAAPDLYRLILKKFGMGLDVEKKTGTLPTHCIYLKETSVDTYGDWTVTADESKIYINANDICGFSAGVSHLINTWKDDKDTAENELAGSGSLQSRTDYDNGETANGAFAAFKPVYTLTYDITNNERTLSYHKGLLDNPAGQTVIYAHRGEHKYYPEASLEAYISAWYSGASIVDVDIQKTKDNVWVCMHDTKLNATTNVDAMQAADNTLPTSDYLKDWTYAQLQQLNLLDSYGQVSSFKIPKLEEALKACAGNVYVGLDDKTDTYETPSAHKQLVLQLGVSPVGLMLRADYGTINSHNEYNGVTLPGIIDLTGTAESLASNLAELNDDVTNLMIPASNPDYYRYVSALLGTGHFTVTRQYKDQVRFFAWMQYKDTDTPAVWAEAEANGYDTFGTNHCIAMMEHIKSSQK